MLCKQAPAKETFTLDNQGHSLLECSHWRRTNLRLQQLLQRCNLHGYGTGSSCAAVKLLCGSLCGPGQRPVHGLYQDEVLPVTWHSLQNSFQCCCCFCLCVYSGCFDAIQLLLPVGSQQELLTMDGMNQYDGHGHYDA